MTEEQGVDQIRLLANLDALLQGPKQRSLQSKDHEKHMQDILVKLAAKIDGKATTEQLRIQLWELFSSRHNWPEHNFPLLFHHGSSELHLSRETTELVKGELAAIMYQDAVKIAPRSQRSRSAVLPLGAESASNSRSSRSELRVLKTRSKGSYKKSRLNPSSSVSNLKPERKIVSKS
jgi:hypothetical protein